MQQRDVFSKRNDAISTKRDVISSAFICTIHILSPAPGNSFTCNTNNFHHIQPTAFIKAALSFFIGRAIGVTASGCSSLQTPRAKTQTSAIYAFGLPAIVVTHDATQTADYSGGDTNETMQSNK